ncbi:MAG: helix-turn-helix transcriptional regulator [Clostridia bacterium]|nr:helix-turn-helix transcriptional regulator [Clostridia bacterium]
MNLKKLRKTEKKTQKEMASILNVAESTYNGYEKEINEPNIETLIKLADYYNVSLDYLVGREFTNDVAYLTQSQKNLIKIISKFDDLSCLKAEAYLEGMLDGKEEAKRNYDRFNVGV